MTLLTFEIVNPSDPLSMRAPSLHIAALAIACVSTKFGVSGVDAEGKPLDSPVLFGWDDWIKREGIDLEAWCRDPEKLRAMGDALLSVCLGKPNDRADFDDAMAAITDEAKRAEFIAKRNDRRRSSLNDIETACHRQGAFLLSKADEITEEMARRALIRSSDR